MDPKAFGAADRSGAGEGGGASSRSRDIEQLNSDIKRDCEALLATGQIPPAQPPDSTRWRKQRSTRSCFLIGIALGGLIVASLNVIVVSAVMAWSAAAAPSSVVPSPSEWASALLWSVVAGAVGLLVPGLWLGAWLWRREERRRVRDTLADRSRAYWQERQQVAHALDQRHMTPRDGAVALGRHRIG